MAQRRTTQPKRNKATSQNTARTKKTTAKAPIAQQTRWQKFRDFWKNWITPQRQRWTGLGVLGVGAIAMIQINEFALAGVLLSFSLILFLFQIYEWEGIDRQTGITKIIKGLLSLMSLIIVVFFAGVIYKSKGDKPWSTWFIKQPQITPTITQPTIADYGSLKSANEPTPNLPQDCFREGDTAIFLGNQVILTKDNSATIVKVAGESVLSFKKTSGGISINAIIRDKENHRVVTIVENSFNILPNSGYRVIKENESTLAVFTPDNDTALYVKLINSSAILIRGIFIDPISGKTFIAKDEIKLGRTIKMNCSRSEGSESLFNL